MSELKSGWHTLRMTNGEYRVRLWSPEAAAASAKTQLTVSQTAVRGQLGILGGTSMTTVTTVVATTTAVGAGAIAVIKVQENTDLEDENQEMQDEVDARESP